jgi:3-deoxy-manno-octulosonate cytidylyltransferase (CMP-KDO synthetase)
MKPIAVIPARYAATRFPGKPLALIRGKPMVWHVYQRAVESNAFGQIIIATDDFRIADAVRAFGAQAMLTSRHCVTGTDRVAEVARKLEPPEDSVLVNVQGDEPAVNPECLRALVAPFNRPLAPEMATLVRPLDEEERGNPNVVKVVLDRGGHALYFSRADIPYTRNPVPELKRWAHLGLYAYRLRTLIRLSELEPTDAERSEGLEQLRAMENGVKIFCGETPHRSVGVDRPEDIAAAEALLPA